MAIIAKQKLHPNSTKVIVQRKMPLVQAAQKDPSTIDWFSQASSEIGAYLRKNGNGSSESGLTESEERILLPHILHMSKDHVEFYKKVDQYYSNFQSTIPASGLELEIGLTHDNDAPITLGGSGVQENLPLKTMDYLRYRHIIGHQSVAMSVEEADKYYFKKYFIERPGEQLKEKNKQEKMIRKALRIADTLIEEGNYDKMEKILTQMGVSVEEIKFGDRSAETVNNIIESDISTKARTDYKNFLEVAEDPDLNHNYNINLLVRKEILKIHGATFVIAESNKAVAKDREEMLYIFKNPDNPEVTEVATYLNAQLAKIKTS